MNPATEYTGSEQHDVPRMVAKSEPTALSISVRHPRRNVAVVKVSGPVDTTNVARFAEILERRADSTVGAIVLDLSEVSFLCVAAIEVLIESRIRARTNRTLLSLVTGTRWVDRPLEALGVASQFTYCTRPVFDGPEHTRVPDQNRGDRAVKSRSA